MTFLQRGGKTAPRLAEDIQLYDTAHPPGTGRNLLSEVPPVYPARYDGPLDYLAVGGCRHTYVTKTNQTSLVKGEHRHGPRTSSKVAAMCSKCRCHLEIVVNHTGGGMLDIHSLSHHIHHLVYKSGRQKNTMTLGEVTDTGQVAETFYYECSDWSCSATVSLRILSPLLSPENVRLLTDPDMIRKRADEAFAAQPTRLEGIAHPLPTTVLELLRFYLLNALHNHERSKTFPAHNKRFMVAFGMNGNPCKELLEFLGFSYLESQRSWEPPQTDPDAVKPYQDTVCIFIDDVIHELVALANSRPAAEKKEMHIPPLPPFSKDDIFDALEASDYPKALRAKDFQMPNAPVYEDLGTLEDMSAAMIVDAYHRQVVVDPSRGPFYLKCLRTIGLLRGGSDWEIIDQAVQVAYSEGKYTTDDVEEAYKYFGLCHDDPNLTEDSIIGKFYAFLSSTSQEAETRTQLWRIGQSRGSERIKAASEDRVTTVEQAHVFLGVDDHTPDDFIITMYTAKVNDSPAVKELADKAVRLIAESRKSEGLIHFLSTGETIASEMDIGDAYRLLQIPDRTADEGAVMAAYTICIDDNPGQTEIYGRALGIIAKEMDSTVLKSMAGITAESDVNVADWPVGLQNIGNTCYLNSLLQFYFSVLPYREMVLNLDKYQMDLGDESGLAAKQVGSRKVTGKEIERSLKFLQELGVLFREMIASPSPSVTPEQELARLTLISPGNEAAIRRRSSATAVQSRGLGNIDGAPILGPLGPPQLIADDQAMTSDEQAEGAPKAPDDSDAESETTLFLEGNGANKLPTSADPNSEEYETVTPLVKPEPPNRPPPVPPRPEPNSNQENDRYKQLIEELEMGAQQDVTEVINNVLFQSQCAIKPRSIASDGEQVDQIKDLFYGQTRSYISTQGGIRSKEERWCDIKVDVASGPRDIYAAIDGAFDVQKISVENSEAEQYGAITKLPPILQIQVQRVQFDPVRKTSFKSINHLQLVDTIFMDRYMDTQRSEILDRRRECWEWKSTLKSLEARRAELLRTQENDSCDMSSLFQGAKDMFDNSDLFGDEILFHDQDTPHDIETSILDDIKQYMDDDSGLDKLEAQPGLPFELEQTAEDVNAELKCEDPDISFFSQDLPTQHDTDEREAIDENILNVQTMIANQFTEFKNLPYQLYAVFVHRGSVSFGHYWIYIRDFQNNIWRKYNDEYVTEVRNLDEIFYNVADANPPTPYFLVYVNEKMKDRLVDPVCREILTNTPPEMTEEVPLYPTDGMNMDLTFDQPATQPVESAAGEDSGDIEMEEQTSELRSDGQYC
ncbi:Peptidase C19 ubiquitin carboxyl-terminal hydrolase 2 [Penicillium hispanicum]|uniref:Peptidase C19 ubiquitin carboxyl-terminal hydrolase 2 n=1 Tax=Penicillium hispanicum TaxID=1080232 RepID=UPI002541B121|nr:Peptidase C19 ubiquitin carboxyl-terminal hydrolase 2 [Penicillium hispanicum]KAJ5570525.1 Peptidase C19 ubiquitin carboxyl-terminal hydrolase 2 [Penicillium hispanicum]